MSFNVLPASLYVDEYGDLVKEYFKELHWYDEFPTFDEPIVWEDTIPDTDIIIYDEEVAGFLNFGFLPIDGLPGEEDSELLLVFYDFFIREEYRGKGLGLTIIRYLTEHWDGSIYPMIPLYYLDARDFWHYAAQELNWKWSYDLPRYLYSDDYTSLVYEAHASQPQRYPAQLFVLDLMKRIASR